MRQVYGRAKKNQPNTGGAVGVERIEAPSEDFSFHIGQLVKADMCAGSVCPGTDGVDDIIVPWHRRIGLYNATVGEVWIDNYGASSYGGEAALVDVDGDGVLDIVEHAGNTSSSTRGTAARQSDGTVLWSKILRFIVTPAAMTTLCAISHAAAKASWTPATRPSPKGPTMWWPSGRPCSTPSSRSALRSWIPTVIRSTPPSMRR